MLATLEAGKGFEACCVRQPTPDEPHRLMRFAPLTPPPKAYGELAQGQ